LFLNAWVSLDLSALLILISTSSESIPALTFPTIPAFFKILETYFVQIIIKVDNKNVNNTEVYNQIRALPGVVVVRVINDERIENLSTGDYDFQLLELKFINKSTPSETINEIKRQALTIFGLVKFYPREKTLNKIRNY
jgi:hypothetical protein